MKTKPTRLKRRIDPDNPLVKTINFRLARSMFDAVNRWRGRKPVGVAIRELVAWALEHKK